MAANPTLQGALLLITQVELVSSTTAAGVLYGIAFSLYCLYVHASFPQLRDHERRRQTLFMVTYSTIILICGLYFLVSNAWVIQDAYIEHANFPGGPLAYEDSTYVTQPVIAVGLVCLALVDILTAAIQIWRLWVVWSSTRYAKIVVILPLLCFLGFLAIRIRSVVISVTLTGEDLVRENTKPQTAELALQATITILPTILIAGFIIFEGQRQSRLIGKSQLSTPYMSIVAMLVESYAMESTWTIIFVILFSLDLPATQFFAETQCYIEIIAYLLVLYRVANGRAYGSQRNHGSQNGRNNDLSSLHWNHTATRSGVDSGTGPNTHSLEFRPETDVVQGRGSFV